MATSATALTVDVTDGAVGHTDRSRVAVVGRPTVMLQGLTCLLIADGFDASLLEPDDDVAAVGESFRAIVLDGRVGPERQQRWATAAQRCDPALRMIIVDLCGGLESSAAAPGAAFLDLEAEPVFLSTWLRAGAHSAVAADRMRAAAAGDAHGELTSQLTAREVEVLRTLMNGDSSADVAQRLSISPHTVRTHVQNILAKLGVRTRHEAATLAFRAGLRPSEKVTVATMRS